MIKYLYLLSYFLERALIRNKKNRRFALFFFPSIHAYLYSVLELEEVKTATGVIYQECYHFSTDIC